MEKHHKKYITGTNSSSLSVLPKKYISQIAITAVCIAGMLLTACTGQAEKAALRAHDTGSRDTIPERHLVEIKNHYLTAVARFAEHDRMIAALKEKAEHKQPQETPGYITMLTSLEHKNAGLKREIEAYRYTGEKKWLAFKEKFDRDINELTAALDQLAQWWN